MTLISSDSPAEPQIPLSKLQALQFEWLLRAGRLSGMATMVVDSNLEIKFYDKKIVDILELDASINYIGKKLLDIAEQLAVRGDFGPGGSENFCRAC